jgi:membrane associated rhomboid family serine protease
VFIPIGDAPNPRGVPYVTYVLIAANVAIYALITLPLSSVAPDLRDPALADYLRMIGPAVGHRIPLEVLLQSVSQYDLFVFTHGFRPVAPSVSTLFFSMFLHASFMHLAGNMLFLWIYGDNVEHRLGPGRYLLAYVGAGVAATVIHGLIAAGSPIPTIGASGAISGVLGFYFIFFPHNTVRMLFFFPLLFMNVILVPARLVLGMYIIADNLLPFLLTSSATGVAYGAHIGGFFAGLGAAWLVDRKTIVAAPHEYARATRAAKVVPIHGGATVAQDLAEKIGSGRFGDAAVEYFSLPSSATHRLLEPDDAMELAGWLRRNGHTQAALTVLRRHLRDYPSGPRRAEAHTAVGFVLLEDLNEPTAAYQHFLDALDLDPVPELAALARRGIATIEARQKFRIR